MANAKDSHAVEFVDRSQAQEAGHTIAITALGVPYSHCHNAKTCENELGQLGRRGDPSTPLPVELDSPRGISDSRPVSEAAPTAQYAYAGGFPSSGHSAILDAAGNLWLCGCDRWQQLGMGSSNGGSSGYTWKGGRLWQERFQRNDHVVELLRTLDPSLGKMAAEERSSRRWIRDVALGGDHTVVLSSNKKDVITFGKGGEHQLGLSSKPWVSSPAKSKALSSSAPNISAVCAHRNCSMILNARGEVLNTAGKCSMQIKGMAKALEMCQKRARETGLNSHERKGN